MEERRRHVSLPGLLERAAEAGLRVLEVDVADPAGGETVPEQVNRGAGAVRLTRPLKEEGESIGKG
jgi:hypothetical protein